MVKIETSLSGDFAGALDRFEKNIQEQVAFAGVAAMAKVIYEQARENAPVATGKLRDAIYRVYSKDRSTDVVKTYQIGWNRRKAPHGHLVEFGTSRAPAHPFLRPAFDHVGEAIDAGRKRMGEKLNEVQAAP